MFCQKCGTSMAEALSACPSCNTPVARTGAAGAGSAAVADTVKAAYGSGLAALKGFAADPVGRLPGVYAGLGDDKAKRVGLTYGVFSVLCFLLGGYLMFPFKDGLFDALGFSGVMKGVLFAVAPFGCAVIGGLGTRKAFGGQGGAGGDFFVAGAALLPMSVAMVINGVLGLENYTAAAVVSVFAGCTGVLMLFSGYSRVARLTERAATLAIPIVVVLTFWVVKMMAASTMESMFGGGMGGMHGGGFGGGNAGFGGFGY